MAKKKDETQKAPAAGPAPSPEETRRKHIEASAKDRFGFLRDDLEALIKGDIKKNDKLDALVAVGESILSLALQTKGRLRAATGQSDAFLEMKAANIKSGLRKAGQVFDTWDKDMTAWEGTQDVIKPILDSIARTVKDLDIPGMKAAIAPSGPALFDEEGQPTEKAVAPPAPPAPEPPPVPAEPDPAPEPPAPAPAPLQARELQTLGMAPGPVIDVEPEPEQHYLPANCEPSMAEEQIQALFEKLEEAGVEECLKRKDWSKAWNLWMAVWPEDCDMATNHKVADLLDFALNYRKPISWAVPTDQEFFAHQRQLAIAAGE